MDSNEHITLCGSSDIVTEFFGNFKMKKIYYLLMIFINYTIYYKF